jgi:hypothetical protein
MYPLLISGSGSIGPSRSRALADRRFRFKFVALHVPYGRATVHSDLVHIPVTVTDDEGKVVTGLNKEQFMLFEDKRGTCSVSRWGVTK